MKIKNTIQKIKDNPNKRYAWFYIAYLVSFIILERVNTVERCHPVHVYLDDMIPFCKYFFVPYLMWHVLIVAIAIYTIINDYDAFKKFSKFLTITYAITLVVYIVYPTSQGLRPDIEFGGDLFSNLVKLFYVLDTPTNTCPSMHVIGAEGIFFCMIEQKRFQSKGWKRFWFCLMVLISISTVFMKQHSIIDVVAAIPVGIIGWLFVYANIEEMRLGVMKLDEEFRAGAEKLNVEIRYDVTTFKRMFTYVINKKQIFTIPNALTLFRVILIPFVCMLYKNDEVYFALLLLAVSWISDFADGFFARKLDQGTDFGRLFDPAADMLTALAIVFCLSEKYPLMWLIFVMIIAKELLLAAYGYMALTKRNRMISSQWFGKSSSFCVYIISALLQFYEGLSASAATGLIIFAFASLLLSLTMYTNFYMEMFFGEKYIKSRKLVLEIFLGLCAAAVIAYCLRPIAFI